MPGKRRQKGAQDQGMEADVDGVFNINLIRHAYYATLTKWTEMNISPDAKAALNTVPEALTSKLGEPETMALLGRLAAAHTKNLKKAGEIPEDETFEQLQQREKAAKDTAERIWESLGRDLQETIRKQRDKTAPKATDTDMKTAVFELVREIRSRT